MLRKTQIDPEVFMALKIVEKNFPDMTITKVIPFDDLYIFDMVPPSGEVLYMNPVAVDKNTNKFVYFHPLQIDDPSRFFDAAENDAISLQ